MYVEINRILTPFQFDFRSGISSQKAIIYFVETLRHEIENGNLIYAVFKDLSKALESLSHKILLENSKSLNFSHSATECIEKFSTKILQQQVQ